MVQRALTQRVIDPGHRSMIRDSIVASPDCRRLAYVARAGKKRFVIVDGKEQGHYDRIENGSLLFSPDSKRFAYVAVERRETPRQSIQT